MAFQLVASSRTLLSTSALIPGSLQRQAMTTPRHIYRTAATCQRLKLSNFSSIGQHRKHIHTSCCLLGRTDATESILCDQCGTVQNRRASVQIRRLDTSPLGLLPDSYSDHHGSSHVIFAYRRNGRPSGGAYKSYLLSQYTPLACTNLDIVVRMLHTEGSGGLRKDESKVEQTVNVLKSEIETKKGVTKDDSKDPSGLVATLKKKSTPDVAMKVEKSTASSSSVEVTTAPPKKTIVQKIVAELKHYYNGFKLLFIDVNVCRKYIWRVLNGQSLTRRERRQLVRTTADMFRLVPFLVFIIIPFMEFLLPIALKLFPSMLPSTFQQADKKVEKVRSLLKVKLEMAKFLQDTIEETAIQRKGAKGESAQQFVEFMEKIRTSGEPTSNTEIMKYSKLFEDEITLDNLQYPQLVALCRLLEIPTVGPSVLLRFQLRLKLRQLEADDLMIQKEGIDSLAEWELQDASRMRGMRSFGVPKTRLKLQLEQWLDLHLNEKIPASLLLLSRTLYIPERLSPSEQLVATIRELPMTTMEEAKVKISEVSGDRVDNKTKLEIIQKEEEAIREEIEEKVMLEEQAEKQKQVETTESLEKLSITPEDIKPVPPLAIETPQPEIPADELMKDIAQPVMEKKDEVMYDLVEEISIKDLEHLEDALEHVADKQMELKLEQQELAALKEDVNEYKEDLKDLKEVIVATGAEESVLHESKGATRLSKQVERMISQMDTVMTSLNTEKDTLLENIEMQEVKIKRNQKLRDDTDLRQTVLDKISEEKEDLVSINELLLAIRRLQKVSHDTKLQRIMEVLDQDKDGCIDINNALKVIELLGRENVKISAQQMADITKLLEAEQKVEEGIQKSKQEKRAAEELQDSASMKEKSSSDKQ